MNQLTSFEETSEQVLRMISEFVGINTLFVARNDKKSNDIIEVFNKDYILLEKGTSLEFEETY